MKQNIMRQKGFTLVEILVVITIIGILASIVYANFNDARVDARNKALQSSLKETQLALELYKAQNDAYPADLNNLVPDFIAKLPAEADSANSECDIDYQTGPSESWYKLTAINCHGGASSQAEGIQSGSEFARCLSTCAATGVCDPILADYYQSYAVYSPGGECM